VVVWTRSMILPVVVGRRFPVHWRAMGCIVGVVGVVGVVVIVEARETVAHACTG